MKNIHRIVQTGVDCSQKSYWRAATQRLDVAEYLLNNSKYYLDAIYLAGYAAECSLKALVLHRTPKSKWAAVCEEIGSGAKAHNLDFLIGILKNRRGVSFPDEVAEGLGIINHEWTTNLRYVGALIPFKEAEDFIENVSLVYLWAERSM